MTHTIQIYCITCLLMIILCFLRLNVFAESVSGQTEQYKQWINKFNLVSEVQKKHEYIKNQLKIDNVNELYTDENGTSFLHLASASGKKDLVEYFISEIISSHDDVVKYINAQDRYKDSPFHKACFNGHTDIVKLLLNHGANLYLPTQGGAICLHITSYNGHSSMIELLVNEYNVPVNLQTDIGTTSLHYAAGQGYITTVKTLIDLGADPNLYTNSGTTPLHVAALKNNYEMMKVLVSYGKADINIRTFEKNNQKTALDVYEQTILKLLSQTNSHNDHSNNDHITSEINTKKLISKHRAELTMLYQEANDVEEEEDGNYDTWAETQEL